MIEKKTVSEVTMWRAVIEQSLEDLRLPLTNKKYRSWNRRAAKWFNDADADFYLVCEMANISAHHVLQLVHHLMLLEKEKD